MSDWGTEAAPANKENEWGAPAKEASADEWGTSTKEPAADEWGTTTTAAGADEWDTAEGGTGGGASGSCYNCGQDGHMSRDCTEPRKPREGEACRRCGEEGHFARECPQAGVPREGESCFQCGSTEHYSSACPGKPVEARERADDEKLAELWKAVVTADEDNEFEDIKAALFEFAHKDPTLTWLAIEAKLREDGLKTVLVAEDRMLPPNKELANNQDEGNQRYEVVVMRNPRLIRKRLPDDEAKAKNTERLAEAGLIRERQRIMGKYDVPEWAMAHLSLEQRAIVANGCTRCGATDHRVRFCPLKNESDVGKCYKCGQLGHSHRTCTAALANGRDNSCRKCGEKGHFAASCPSGGGGRACHNCGEEGHFAADCDQPRKPRGECHNCGEEGHFAADCEQPRKPRGCYNCGGQGHRANDCPTGGNGNSGSFDAPASSAAPVADIWSVEPSSGDWADS